MVCWRNVGHRLTIDGFGDNSLITGVIVGAHEDEEALRLSNDGDLIHRTPLPAYLSPGRFANIQDRYAFPFPADFKQ